MAKLRTSLFKTTAESEIKHCRKLLNNAKRGLDSMFQTQDDLLKHLSPGCAEEFELFEDSKLYFTISTEGEKTKLRVFFEYLDATGSPIPS